MVSKVQELSSNNDFLDFQGIKWGQILPGDPNPRKTYRTFRNRSYKPFRSAVETTPLKNYPKCPRTDNPFVELRQFHPLKNLYLGHFQLRYNVSAVSHCEFFTFSSMNSIIYFNTISKETKTITLPVDLNPTGLSANRSLFAIADHRGRMVIMNYKTDQILYNSNITDPSEQIVNFIEILDSCYLRDKIMTAANDCTLKLHDLNKLGHTDVVLKCEQAINNACFSPDRKLISASLDKPQAEIYDYSTRKKILSLEGHEDYGFASVWYPDPGSYILVTGNQDRTCRVWDIRNPHRGSLKILQGELGATHCLKFMKQKYLVVGEAIDFVKIYDASNDYNQEQVIDFFGELNGLDVSPEGEKLVIAMFIKDYGGIFEFEMTKNTPLQTFLMDAHI